MALCLLAIGALHLTIDAVGAEVATRREALYHAVAAAAALTLAAVGERLPPAVIMGALALACAALVVVDLPAPRGAPAPRRTAGRRCRPSERAGERRVGPGGAHDQPGP